MTDRIDSTAHDLRGRGGDMYSARTSLIVLAALAAGAVLALGASAAPAWPTCLGEPATIVGTEAGETITGTGGDDVIVALGGDDVVRSGGANDTDLICGGDGNDALIATTGGSGLFAFDGAWISGDAGDDRIQGSADTFVAADYEASPEAVTADLGTGVERGWGNDTLVHVTIVDGSRYDDVLSGSATMDGLYGEGGNDTIVARGGVDFVSGGPGNDSLDGGLGRDWVDYWDSSTGVRVNLGKHSAAGAGLDRLRSIERVNGSKHADVLVGGPGADQLDGGAGNDRLYGGGGRDALNGEKGKDRADGGPARDVCRAERTLHCP